ncbi:hypothetical protein Taro_007945 [Colocasia esculenta]|uniref:non-specific serine/threonine protein kinase n=1 Tax=Colocasia esculenta TaxID=4460 RepID=A0A843TSL7_COLES|nr:hypothetical protein [Colocasia esculenta]
MAEGEMEKPLPLMVAAEDDPSAPAMASPPSPSHLLSFLFLLLLLSCSSSPAAATNGDLQLLLSFKASLPGPDRALPTWLPGANLCASFAGVSCRALRVASVSIRDLPLDVDFAAVSASLLSLDRLESLSLQRANITGELAPGPASRCGGRLLELDLSGNALQGSVSAGIPALAAACPSLRRLNLSGNSLGFSLGAGEGDGVGAMQLQLGGLDVLDLSLNRFTGGAALGWLLRSGAGLRELYLADSGVGGTVPVAGNCSALQRLDLSSNTLSGLAPAAFAACDGLAYLNLSNNHLAGELPAGLLGACRGLVEADLSSNTLSGALPTDFSRCSLLESLSLSNNNLSGELIAEAVAGMAGLRRLDLSFNKFSGKLPDVLPDLPGLELLDLSANLLEGSIPPGLCRGGHSSLRELCLQNNLLTGVVPPTISNCSMLVSIDLSFNYIRGELPASMGFLPRLRDLIMWQNLLEGEMPGELGLLQALENLILDDNGLSGAIPAGLANCTSLNWISLSGNRLAGPIPPWLGRFSNLAILKLGNNSLSGSIPPELGDCKSLIWLDLNSNQLSGAIPAALAKQSGSIAVGLVAGKRYVYMKNDGSSECHGAGNLLEFAGIRQEQLSRVPTRRSCNFTRVYMGSTQYTFNNNGSALFLDLSYNRLQGTIPPELGRMYYLMVLNLGHNDLSGAIPPELGKLKNIGILDLSHNALEGPIPSTFSDLSMLAEIDLSNNKLNGTIPVVGQLATFPAPRYMNNTGLCGFPLPPCGQTNATATNARQRSRRRQASLAGSFIAMAFLLSLFCILGVVVLAVERRRRRRQRQRRKDGAARDGYNMDSRTHSGGGTAWKLTLTKEALSMINLATFEPKATLQKLTLGDLVEATNGFHGGCLVGSGGFGDVYRAELKDGSVVAVKRLIHISGQGDREFTAEMETIGKVKHRNLVPLLGYCKVAEERLLVYEYMKHGSLEDVLHDRKKVGGVRLNWAARRRIAVGAARGLAFLHHNCIPHIIHRDMKSSNVLLDGDLEARVSDFGMARLVSAVDTHLSVSTLAGTPGYVPPEYYQSFRCSTKGDVYSFGVVLLELLTGRRPTDSADFGDNNNLVGWVRQQHPRRRLADVFDPTLLRDDPSLELELLEHLKVACACLDDRPARRPTMLNVMAMFKEIQAGSTVGSAGAGTPSVDDDTAHYGVMGLSLHEEREDKDY